MKTKILLGSIICFIGIFKVHGQSFLQEQLSFPVVGNAYKNKEDTLKKQFAKDGLVYPAKYIYIRSFKYDSQLEVWVKNHMKDTFRLFKTYRICALSGILGPKRSEGDYQVPEGFYYISQFQPNSDYHLSLGLNYPNYSDRLIGENGDLGGGIFIHGSCVTVGCIPLTDSQIEELYILAVNARNLGEDFIPVHIFPIRFNNKRSTVYLQNTNLENKSNLKLWKNLKEAYDYFNDTHRIPLVMINPKGDYVLGKFKVHPQYWANAKRLSSPKPL